MLEGILNGRYEIKERVGSGGMAEVYRGFDLTDQKEVAIKVLKQEYSNDPQYLRRLAREAEAMVSLKTSISFRSTVWAARGISIILCWNTSRAGPCANTWMRWASSVRGKR